MRVTVDEVIWQLPDCFTDELCQRKSTQVYQHIYDNYWGPWSQGQSTYASAPGIGVRAS